MMLELQRVEVGAGFRVLVFRVRCANPGVACTGTVYLS
jgi:hypothetical protein